MAEGTWRPVVAPSWESSPAAFVLVGAAGMVSVACGDDQQVRVGLCVQAAPVSLEAAAWMLGSQQHGGTCSQLRVPGWLEQKDRAPLLAGGSGGVVGWLENPSPELP